MSTTCAHKSEHVKVHYCQPNSVNNSYMVESKWTRCKESNPDCFTKKWWLKQLKKYHHYETLNTARYWHLSKKGNACSYRVVFIKNYLHPLGAERTEWSAVLTSTSLNISGISASVLFMPEWPKQPLWLTGDKYCLKNEMISHQCATRLENSMRRRSQAVVTVHGSSTQGLYF